MLDINLCSLILDTISALAAYDRTGMGWGCTDMPGKINRFFTTIYAIGLS
jgi:hypothetical protein